MPESAGRGFDPAARLAASRWLGEACRRFLVGGKLDGSSPLAFEAEAAGVGRLAAAHAVEPLLHSLLASGEVDARTVPADLREGWLAAYVLTQLVNRRRLAVLEGAFERCRERGLELAALKGPVHVARVYGDPGLRPMVDVDLLCRREQLGSVTEVLRSVGYEPERVSSLFHLSLRHRESGDLLELHFDLYELIAGRELFLEELWSSAVECEVGGVRLRAPAPEVAVAIDLAHLINHDLRVGLRQAVDLCGQLLPDRVAGLNPERLEALLARMDLTAEASAVAGVVERLLDLPQGSLGLSVQPPPALVEQVAGTWARLDELGAPPALNELSYRSGWRAKVDYLRWMLIPGTDGPAAQTGTASRHLGGLLRSAWRKLHGSRSGWRGPISLKRDVYRRRGQSGGRN